MTLPQHTFPQMGVQPFDPGNQSNVATEPHDLRLEPVFLQNGFFPMNPQPEVGSTTTPQWGFQRPSELLGITETMSGLDISGCAQPPPSKIRRRNALTIQDPTPFQYANGVAATTDPSMVQQSDAFQNSFLLQRMEELKKRLGGIDPTEMTVNVGRDFDHEVSPPPPSPVPAPSSSDEFLDFSGPGKRKIPSARRQREIEKISLHPDLKSYKPKTDFDLPKSLLRRYSTSQQCHALVLYQPPIDFLAQLQQKEETHNFVSVEEKEMKEKYDDDGGFEKMCE